jgi:hypothetical protein
VTVGDQVRADRQRVPEDTLDGMGAGIELGRHRLDLHAPPAVRGRAVGFARARAGSRG